ncbi:hypothetical protein [Halomonas sp. E14]|uniref:hypothetical protein n=1 Tax=Halomonas sp. E14 TaxID=3397245 RepID=UPI00403ED898
MLTTDSMSLLWLTYLGLSLVVLVTGYLGLAFLPRLVRLPLTWAVAGMLWVPTRFRLPLVEEGEFYTGFAPAVVVTAVAFLERNLSGVLASGLLVAAGAGLGVALGLLQWWWLRSPDADEEAPRKGASAKGKGKNNNRRSEHDGRQARKPQVRREPRVG